MKLRPRATWWVGLWLIATASFGAVAQRGEVIAVAGTVRRTRSGVEAAVTNGTRVDFGDRLSTGENSRATIRWEDNTEYSMRELSSVEIVGPKNGLAAFIDLFQGAVYFFSRDKRHELRFRTPHAVGGTRGTEYELRASEVETVLTLSDGGVEISNALGRVAVETNAIIFVTATTAPRVAGFAITNVVQWWLYYPAVLDVNELKLAPAEAAALASALQAYRNGHVRGASEAFRRVRPAPQSDNEKIFYAALRLALGEAGDAEAALRGLPEQPGIDGMRRLIAAITVASNAPASSPLGASGWLGESYVRQSRRDFSGALAAAKKSCELSPEFGFAWARRAELEFGSGDRRAADSSLALALKFSPSNAPAHVLRGFVLAGGNHLTAARASFLRARELEPFMGQAWLGLGLLQFRSGDRSGGLSNLQTAAVLEPNRSLARSYLGKAYAENFDGESADKEWKLAENLDASDPTPWLYRALEHYDANHINSAIDALEQSIALNHNRALYRSGSLLDQDRAVRGASLARIYQRAGMSEVALREAAVSVSYDYSDPSAHLFLADAFNALRDPTRFDLRHETAWFNEVLLANALSPVDAGVIAPSLSDQEYTRLFARDGFRLSSFGEARSDGQFRQLATQSGIFGRFAYAIDLDWQHNDGTRRNQRLDRTEVYPQMKYQVTDADTALVLLKFQDYHSGDNFQYLDQTNARPHYRFDEHQSPIAVGIWRHEWKPGVQTLALGGRLENDQRFSDRAAPFAVVLEDISGNPIDVNNLPLDLAYRSRVETYVGELQQIARLDWSTFVVGARGQWGSIETSDQLTGDPGLSPDFGDTTGTGLFHRTKVRADFSRMTIYAYDTMPLADQLALTLGVAWDSVELPRNFRHAPIQDGEDRESRVEPKAGVVWRPFEALTFRGMYAQSLGGATLDESYRLEPVQLAGFSQAFRTVIPESIAGSVSGHRLDLGGAALDVKLPTRTYLGVAFTDTRSRVDREIGAFAFDTSFGDVPPGRVIRAREKLRYQEDAVQFTVNQLAGDYFVLGAAYRFGHTRLEDRFSFPVATRTTEADVHQFRLSGVVNLPGGWFGRLSGTWYWQDSTRTFGTRPTNDETVQQTDFEAGWRFPRRFGEISAGVLNVFDENYRLEPLSALPDLPRERVLFVRLRLNF